MARIFAEKGKYEKYYLVSIILLLYYIGTKKKIESFFTPHPNYSNPPYD